MATNNNVNNNFPSGITSTGTTNINTTGSGTTSIGNSSGAALVFASNDNSTATFNNANFTLTTGTGAISLCADNTAQTITIGSASTNTFNTTGVLSISSGTASTDTTFSFSSTIGFSVPTASSPININSTGIISFANNNGSAWNLNTGAGANTLNIGNSSSSSAINIDSGTGAINIAETVTFGNTTGATQINISSGTGGISFSLATASGTSFNFIPGRYYSTNNASLVTGTLPSTVAIGSRFIVSGNGAGGWKVAQNASQQIFTTGSNTTSGTGGSVSSGGRYDSVELVCVTANTDFVIVNSKGTLVFA